MVWIRTNALSGPVAPLDRHYVLRVVFAQFHRCQHGPNSRSHARDQKCPTTIIGSGAFIEKPRHTAEPDGPQARTRTGNLSASGFDRRLNRRALVA